MPELRRPGARPTQPRRMAAERINEIFQPWVKRPNEGTAGQGGKTQKQWVENNRKIATELDRFNSEDDMFNYLINEQGFNDREAGKLAQEAYDSRGPLSQLRTEKYGVPNASADEMLNMAALLESGFTEVKPGEFMGTDIQAVNPSGRRLLIDAQMRTGLDDSWSIPVLGNARTAGSAFRSLNYANTSLGDFIDKMIDENPNAWADKLLHSQALHREFFGRGMNDNKVKDALISTRRSRRSYDTRRDNPYGARDARGYIIRQHGPYNPMRGDTIDMVDLGELRANLLNKSISELQQKGVTNVGGLNAGGFRLSIPNKIIRELSNNTGTLDPNVVSALSIPPLKVKNPPR